MDLSDLLGDRYCSNMSYYDLFSNIIEDKTPYDVVMFIDDWIIRSGLSPKFSDLCKELKEDLEKRGINLRVKRDADKIKKLIELLYPENMEEILLSFYLYKYCIDENVQ